MIFCPENCELILAGKKTQTRRLRVPGMNGDMLFGDLLEDENLVKVSAIERNGRMKWEVGHTYAVQPGRGKKAIGRIRITKIRSEHISDITNDDAIAEGVQETRMNYAWPWVFNFKGQDYFGNTPREAFCLFWKVFFGGDLTELVWVLDFELENAGTMNR